MKNAVRFLEVVMAVSLLIWMATVELRLQTQSRFNGTVADYVESQGQLNRENLKALRGLVGLHELK